MRTILVCGRSFGAIQGQWRGDAATSLTKDESPRQDAERIAHAQRQCGEATGTTRIAPPLLLAPSRLILMTPSRAQVSLPASAPLHSGCGERHVQGKGEG